METKDQTHEDANKEYWRIIDVHKEYIPNMWEFAENHRMCITLSHPENLSNTVRYKVYISANTYLMLKISVAGVR